MFLSLRAAGTASLTVTVPLNFDITLFPDLTASLNICPFAPTSDFCASSGFDNFVISIDIVFPSASPAICFKVSLSRLISPAGVLTVTVASVSFTMLSTVFLSSSSFTVSASLASDDDTFITISADLFSLACFTSSLAFSSVTVAVAVFPDVLTSVGVVVIFVSVPEVVTSYITLAGVFHCSEPDSLV